LSHFISLEFSFLRLSIGIVRSGAVALWDVIFWLDAASLANDAIFKIVTNTDADTLGAIAS
jgi:hypothetical protein